MRSVFKDISARCVCAAIALFVVTIGGTPAHALTMLDQENVGGSGGSDAVVNNVYRAQTFTVGLTGTMTRFEIPIRGSANGGSGTFEIWGTTATGAPEAISPAAPLASETVTWTSAGGFVGADISVPVTAGDMLALVYIGGSDTDPGTLTPVWRQVNDQYIGGQSWGTLTSDPSGAWMAFFESTGGADFRFRTFVDVPMTASGVPEPVTATLGLISLAAFGYSTKRRKA